MSALAPQRSKGAWSTSKHAQAAGVGFFKYQWASGAVVQMVVTSRSHQPPRTYGSFRLLPLANAGATGLPSELESAFVQAISSRFPTATSGQPASPVSDAEAALDIEMLVNAYLEPYNYNSYNVAITYTMRDGGTGELMGRVDGFGFVRGEEKHRAKDIATIAAGCVVRKAF